MQFRYFAADFDEVVQHFSKLYGKDKIMYAKEQHEFEACIFERMATQKYKAIILDTFLFFDILTEDNIYRLSHLKKSFTYIVFVGDRISELNDKIKKLKL